MICFPNPNQICPNCKGNHHYLVNVCPRCGYEYEKGVKNCEEKQD